ncbi:VOC family protein [Pseudoroseomonas cervicalis]|uniref:VOC family protein n=1 Tax=Teichococcus cervicalis TaxID=204525 RepID=UPI0022F15E31|nr:VOC family protein [Pseudoroseomonas cervicalis]WBV41806.1 VOC family protein [Pseudoroseomonas cervicalis]
MTALLKPAIDHVVIHVGPKLDAAAERYSRLGFQLTERGHHTMGSSNNLAIFGTDYLELLGYEPGRATDRAALWQMPNGLGGLVFKPTGEADFRDRLAAAGLPVSESREFSRPVALPDGSAPDARFRVTHLGPEVAFNGRVFFCHHFTPELVWRQEWQRHANGVTGIAEFGIVSNDPARAVAPYATLFGDEAVQELPGGRAILAAGGARVLVLRPEAAALHWGDALPPLPQDGADRMVALTLRAELAAAAAALRQGGITPLEQPGRLTVPAAEACGLALSFAG